MKYALAVLFIIVFVAMSVSQASSSSIGVEKHGSWAAGPVSSSMEKKLLSSLQALKDASQAKEESASENDSQYTAEETSINASALNSSPSINLTASGNSSATNATLLNSSLSSIAASSPDAGAFSLSGNSTVNSQGVSADTNGRVKGFWGMQASQKGFGKSGIDSRTMLSGDFDVEKTVKFQDRSS